MKSLSRSRKILLALFVVALTFTGYHLVRTVASAIYWQQHRDETIERWMPIGYIAHSYHVPPWILERALGLSGPDPRPVGRIAEEQGRSFDETAARLNDAIVHARPPYPPPGPPPAPGQTVAPKAAPAPTNASGNAAAPAASSSVPGTPTPAAPR